MAESDEDTLPGVLRGFVDGVWSPGASGDPLLRRIRSASWESAPRLRGASRNSARDLLAWTKQGTGLRAILVISPHEGTTIAIQRSSGRLLLAMPKVATRSASSCHDGSPHAAGKQATMVIGGAIVPREQVLMSFAAAGGFLALFFSCLVAVYVGAVSIAIFVISATVISATVGVMIATGWVGFFWTIWFAARKSMDLTKHSIGMTSSAVKSYSTSRHARQKPTD